MTLLTPEKIKPNAHFVGREDVKAELSKLNSLNEAAILVVYGRRRVGKTELIEQHFRNRNILKFEGLEGLDTQTQINTALIQLSSYIKESKSRNPSSNDPLKEQIKQKKFSRWIEFFDLLSKYVAKGVWTIYFEEVQWLAQYEDQFISELKSVWDNKFRHNQKLLLILCGSSPSFMINSVLHSKALYNRSHNELHLQPFSLIETRAFLGQSKSKFEVLDAHLAVGGIPEYLKYLRKSSSVYLALCQNSFVANGFFLNEFQRIFTSSLAKNPHYQAAIQCLGKSQAMSRSELSHFLKLSSGGSFSRLMADLELCGFIEKKVPLYQKNEKYGALFSIADHYLHFYFKFIEPIRARIIKSDFQKDTTKPLPDDAYRKWLGYAFERYCRSESGKIAKHLGFSAVNYKSGSLFLKKSNSDLEPRAEFETKTGQKAAQIDLIYDRQDRVFTVCEVKYQLRPVGTKIINDFEAKLDLVRNLGRRHSIHKVLIAPYGADQALLRAHYFDDVLTLDDLL